MDFTFSYVDLAVIILLTITTLYGKHKGLLLSAYSFASYFLTFILTRMFYPTFARYLSSTDLYTQIHTAIYNKLDFKEKFNAQTYSSGSEVLSDMGVPDFMIDIFGNSVNIDTYEYFDIDQYRSLLSASVTETILSMLAFVTVFILVIVGLKIVGMLLHIIRKLPIISQLDSFGGGLFGFLNGVVFIIIAFILISAIFILSLPPDYIEAFNNSFFYNLFTNTDFFNNFIVKLIS